MKKLIGHRAGTVGLDLAREPKRLQQTKELVVDHQRLGHLRQALAALDQQRADVVLSKQVGGDEARWPRANHNDLKLFRMITHLITCIDQPVT